VLDTIWLEFFMVGLFGYVVPGAGHFAARIKNNEKAFTQVTGEKLFYGTLNVKVDVLIPIKEHFRMRGSEIEEPLYDFLFEVCKVNGVWAYRVKPLNLLSARGGHGDNVIELVSSQKIPDVNAGAKVQVMFFR
jgi:CTP-dependent riboflavin kinase